MILTSTTSLGAAMDARGASGIADALDVANASAIRKNDVLIKGVALCKVN